MFSLIIIIIIISFAVKKFGEGVNPILSCIRWFSEGGGWPLRLPCSSRKETRIREDRRKPDWFSGSPCNFVYLVEITMILPLVKLGSLALKTLCKPIASKLKKEAGIHPKFRQFIVNIAQVLELFESSFCVFDPVNVDISCGFLGFSQPI